LFIFSISPQLKKICEFSRDYLSPLHVSTNQKVLFSSHSSFSEMESAQQPWLKRIRSNLEKGVYEELVGAPGNSQSDDKLDQDVAKDVPRSFGGKPSTVEEQAAMTEVLTAFGRYEKGVGYTQGMGFIVCFALRQQGNVFTLETKENAFWLLVDAASRVPEGFFARAAHDEVLVFEEIVRNHAPAITDHLRDDLQSALCYLIPRWFLSLYVFTMPEETTLRIWNEILFPFPESEQQVSDYTKSLSFCSRHTLLAYSQKSEW
jgi:Rab-GTPase-TBC domain